jgi:hypothetical protein
MTINAEFRRANGRQMVKPMPERRQGIPLGELGILEIERRRQQARRLRADHIRRSF